MRRPALLALALLGLAACAPSLPAGSTAVGPVRSQVGDDPRWARADWDDGAWAQVPASEIDSTDRILWLRARIDRRTLPPDGHVSVTLSAVGACEIYWNGTRIGGAGRPGASRAEEVPGPMTASAPVPAALLAGGENVVAVRLSSFRLPGRLRSTVHFFTVGPPFDFTALMLRGYLPGLAAGGALLLGACYFAALFLSDRRDRAAGYLALLALAAVGQLVAEGWRGLVNYEYPVHVYRLWTILGMACIYGLGLVAYVTERCDRRRQRAAVIATAVAAGGVIGFVPGYDGKTALTILIAAVVSLWCAAAARPRHLLLLVAPVGLLAWFLLAPMRFLDQHYLVTASAIFMMFFEQVQHLRSEQAARAAAELRSARLELELLKRYIQPHFLLNTLTSLCEWVETDPEVGVRMIEALAEEFRLLARVGARRTIDVRDEVALCQLHLRVMSLRHDAPLQLDTEGLDEGRQLPPAVLHTLLENALTHNRYPRGARFHLRESSAKDSRRYELRCPAGDEDPGPPGPSAGTGLEYVRARLSEVFADRWRLTDGRAADGGWITCIEVPA